MAQRSQLGAIKVPDVASAPAAPSSGRLLYTRSGTVYTKDSAGAEVAVSSATHTHAASTLTGSYVAGHHPEGRVIANAFFTNDLANLRLRGGSLSATGYTFTNAQIDTMFDGTAATTNPGAVAVGSPIVMTITLPRNLSYSAWLGIGFGNPTWRANTVRIEAFSEGVWKDVVNTTTNTSEELYAAIPGNAGGGTTQIRVTLADATALRICHIWGYNYNSDMWTQVMMPRKGGSFYGPVAMGNNAITGLPAPSAGGDAANKTYVDTQTPTGAGMEWYTSTPPTGWLMQDGGEYPIATYTALYNVLTANGTVFPFGANTNGAGAAGSTHFRTPNRKGRAGVGRDAAQTEFDTVGETGGAKTHTLTVGEIPGHDHGGVTGSGVSNANQIDEQSVREDYYTGTYGLMSGGAYSGRPMLYNLTAETGHTHTISSQGGGGAHNNLPPYIVVNYIIKT